VRSTRTIGLVSEVLLVASLLGACVVAPGGGSRDDAANYSLDVAAELHVAGTQQQVAACLRQRENTASYPQGISPGFTATESDADAVRITQWFYLKRGGEWTTRFVLRPAGDGATNVQVLLPTALSMAQGYRRASVELIARCQADLGAN